MSTAKRGWQKLLDGYPWFRGEERFPLAAYSEFMPPPHLGRTPYGEIEPLVAVSRNKDPAGWPVSEIEEEYELRPGLDHIAEQVIGALTRLSQGKPVYHIAGHQASNLQDNPYWSAELAQAGELAHERYVLLLPLALSRTQDDKGRVRWTLFGGSEQGTERAFWKSFYLSSDKEQPRRESLAFIVQLLKQVYNEDKGSIDDSAHLKQIGFGILPTKQYRADTLPAWTKPFVYDGRIPLKDVRYLLTFKPFSELPASVRERYLAGDLHLLPCPHSLIFWGMQTYQHLKEELPLAMQIPLLRLFERRESPGGLRVLQSGWLHETHHTAHPKVDPASVQPELIKDHYARTSRWSRVQRYDDELAMNPREDKVSKVLFSTALDVMGLYDKPMARNCQIWGRDFRLLLDGPNASHKQLEKAEQALIDGGLFGYRFIYPAMHVGQYEVYWQRPLVAFSNAERKVEVIHDGLLGYLVAYPTEPGSKAKSIELWPRLLRRENYLSALHNFAGEHEHYKHQMALNILTLLDSYQMGDHRLRRSLARYLLRIAKHETLEQWLDSIPACSAEPAEGKRIQAELQKLIEPTDPPLPKPITYDQTANRAFEEAWWNDISFLSHGQYVNKDNADVVQDPPTSAKLIHHQRDLERLGDYLLERYRQVITAAGMEGKALCGDLPFKWQTDFAFSEYGGWRLNQDHKGRERDILVVIPGKNRGEAVVMADHYDTAYMEDLFDKGRGGTGARLSAAGADDNHSATATLLQAAPIFLKLAKEGRLERDVWLLHLTGEEFPADCLGARHFSQMLVEGTLKLHIADKTEHDLSSTRVTGLLVMDMIAHNRDDAQDIFQISPGKSAQALAVAEQAHLANMIWNALAPEWNEQPDRRREGRGRRSADGITMPTIARHPLLHGEVRTADDPQSSLYNTDGQIFSDVGIPGILFMENYDINREGYHDTHDTLENIDLDYGSAVAAIAIETIARLTT